MALGSVGRWVGWGHVGWLGVSLHTCVHACACMHMHTCTHTHGHTCIDFMQMAVRHWGNPWEFPMFHMHVHACMCVCAWVNAWDIPSLTHAPPHSTSTHPPHPQGEWTSGISQNSIALELIEIFQFHLKI